MNNTDENDAQLQKWDEERDALQKRYWYQQRKLYTCQCNIASGPIKLAYESLRENPKWWMQKELVKDCAGRGGCCGRGCGCCEKREPTPGRRMGAGHCTSEFACYVSSQGFEFTTEEEDNIRDALRVTLDNLDSRDYLLTLSHAYLLRDNKVEHVDLAPKRSTWREIIRKQ
ncbi:hypothetical protein N7517_010422 [Penicillium concentricum]|uniref:Uncharacterized protein n=1 Tax=Penicillium concentricum TaxID=293559 RepID=A0A9W9RE31_9EURO|nr:uncharacterized protein N7517_010422 [Penicillium concentricum]KAJ5355813.1 hypothetical protein N7517_010422 [Penicillium concentricum]